MDYICLIEAGEVVKSRFAHLQKLFKRFPNEKHVIEHGIIKLFNPRQSLLFVLVNRKFILGEPLKQSMAGVAINSVFIDLFIPADIVGY